MFGQRPSQLLGILDEAVAYDFDLEAWRVLSEEDDEREAAEMRFRMMLARVDPNNIG